MSTLTSIIVAKACKNYTTLRAAFIVCQSLLVIFCGTSCLNLKPLHDQDVNASNVEKNTPLHWACLNGHVEVIIAAPVCYSLSL